MHHIFLWISLIILTFSFPPLHAQESSTWQELYHRLIFTEGQEDEQTTDQLDYLSQLADQPINVNQATYDDLIQIPFLSEQHIADILEYIYRHHAMQSMAELYLIPSLDRLRCELLSHFLVAGPTVSTSLSLKNIFHYAQQKAVLSTPFPIPLRLNNSSTPYEGSALKHSIRYTFNAFGHIKLGCLGAKDAGEPFFKNIRQGGYDDFSFYLQLNNLQRLNTLLIGRYRIKWAQGILINNNFSMGNLTEQTNFTHAGAMIRPHFSQSSANYLQGIASTLRLSQPFTATAFLSYRWIDVILKEENEGEIQSILKTGYHRTSLERARKNNATLFTSGLLFNYRLRRFNLGAGAIFSQFNRKLNPKITPIYRRWAPAGQHFTNYSIAYGYHSPLLSIQGETTLDHHLQLATANMLSLQLLPTLKCSVLQRFYAYRFISLLGNSYALAHATQDENGCLTALEWKPLKYLSAFTSFDFAYFAWPKFQQYFLGSHSWKLQTSLRYQRKKYELSAFYQARKQQKDHLPSKQRYAKYTHLLKLEALVQRPLFTARTSLFTTLAHELHTDWGILLKQTLRLNFQKVKVTGMIAYFYAPTFNSKIYMYEQGTPYSFPIKMFYGHGLRYGIHTHVAIHSKLQLYALCYTSTLFKQPLRTTSSAYHPTKPNTHISLQLAYQW